MPDVRAVVFDFFGTLSINASKGARRAGAHRVAAALGVPGDVYFEEVGATFTERATGSTGDVGDTIRWLAGRCGYAPTDEQVTAAAEIRWEVESAYIRDLRPEAVDTVRAVKECGLSVGLISDCTHELPVVWPTLPIAEYVDATLFSSEAGLRKPHPDLYAAVVAQLGVAPETCVYVGDGGSGELTGATRAGMTAYRLLDADAVDAFVYDHDSEWSGPTITSLSQVLDLLPS